MTRFVLLLAALAAPLAAQDASPLERGRALVDAGSQSGSADSLMAARATLGVAAGSDDPETAAWARYYTALADYRLSYLFWGSDSERALRHAEQGAAALAPVADDRALGDGVRAEASALRATLLGTQMGLDPARSATLGRAASAATMASIRLAPDNPRVRLQSGIGLVNTPPEWGGDRAQAIRQLERAISLFDAAPLADAAGETDAAGATAPTWGRDEAYAWLGLAHLMDGDPAAARPMIETAARLNPASAFVQYKLMPWLVQLEASRD